MSTQIITDRSPGTALFPEYHGLYELITREVEGLTDAQLDFSSAQWAWAAWSIRRQLSHMAFASYFWLLVRWGATLFPDGNHGVDDVQALTAPGFDRCLDERRYWDLPVLLEKLQEGMTLIQRVLAAHNVGFLRSQTDLVEIRPEARPTWRLILQAIPTGITLTANGSQLSITLEATLRHLYFEETTHLYNIQRLKRAQGLSTIVDVPRVGYWVLDGWDRSEP
jgi:hypothetical protein